MRLFGAVVMIAGMVWMMVGCGGVVAPLVGGAVKGGAARGVVLADSVTQTRYSLSVADGAAALTEMSGLDAVASGPELLDGVTGAAYSLGLASGALTLGPGESSPADVAQIGLADTVTGKTYALAVASGALTLTRNEGAAQ